MVRLHVGKRRSDRHWLLNHSIFDAVPCLLLAAACVDIGDEPKTAAEDASGFDATGGAPRGGTSGAPASGTNGSGAAGGVTTGGVGGTVATGGAPTGGTNGSGTAGGVGGTAGTSGASGGGGSGGTSGVGGNGGSGGSGCGCTTCCFGGCVPDNSTCCTDGIYIWYCPHPSFPTLRMCCGSKQCC